MSPKFILDDTAQYYDRFGSDCSKCVHFNGEEEWNCPAFPGKIPLVILGGQKHRKPWSTQKNKIVFKKKQNG